MDSLHHPPCGIVFSSQSKPCLQRPHDFKQPKQQHIHETEQNYWELKKAEGKKGKCTHTKKRQQASTADGKINISTVPSFHVGLGRTFSFLEKREKSKRGLGFGKIQRCRRHLEKGKRNIGLLLLMVHLNEKLNRSVLQVSPLQSALSCVMETSSW